MSAFYNEIEPYAAQWLRNLSTAGHIAEGQVDERSIEVLAAHDVAGFTQSHFFAGIGVWSYALRLAGWPDDLPVWTGSCPCQPFSDMGKREGIDDDRHLWPAWFKLIKEHRPPVIFGEQVEAAVRHGWLDAVQADMEGIDYAIGAITFPAASVGAPEGRHRTYFVAYSNGDRLGTRRGQQAAEDGNTQHRNDAEPRSEPRSLANTNGRRGRNESSGISSPASPHAETPSEQRGNGQPRQLTFSSTAGELGDAISPRLEGHSGDEDRVHGSRRLDAATTRSIAEAGYTRGFWGNVEWLHCRDGKYRPAQPGIFPLAHGATARVGKIRAAGNAIVAQQAAVFIRAAVDSIGIDLHTTARP